ARSERPLWSDRIALSEYLAALGEEHLTARHRPDAIRCRAGPRRGARVYVVNGVLAWHINVIRVHNGEHARISDRNRSRQRLNIDPLAHAIDIRNHRPRPMCNSVIVDPTKGRVWERVHKLTILIK